MAKAEMSPLPRKTEEISIIFADDWRPGEEPNIGEEASFGIRDPRKPGTKNSFCIGHRYRGGPIEHPRSWKPSGTLYWPDDNYQCVDDTEPVRYPNSSLNRILRPRGTTVQELFVQFLRSNTRK